LYQRWQSGLSPLPAAPPGASAHEFGFAFDLVVTPWEALADVGYTWEQWGGVWGSQRDPVHFEYPGFVPPSRFPELLGESMGKATRDVYEPWTGSIPYMQEVLKVTAEHEPYATASLAAQLYLWLNR
jgi:hypothetical protein